MIEASPAVMIEASCFSEQWPHLPEYTTSVHTTVVICSAEKNPWQLLMTRRPIIATYLYFLLSRLKMVTGGCAALNEQLDTENAKSPASPGNTIFKEKLFSIVKPT